MRAYIARSRKSMWSLDAYFDVDTNQFHNIDISPGDVVVELGRFALIPDDPATFWLVNGRLCGQYTKTEDMSFIDRDIESEKR